MSTPTVYTPLRLMIASTLTGTNATYYTSPAGELGTQVKEIILTNTTTSATTVTLYLVETGGTAGDSNTLLKAVAMPVDGNPFILEFDGLFMNASDTIQGLASVTARIALHVSGVELQ